MSRVWFCLVNVKSSSCVWDVQVDCEGLSSQQMVFVAANVSEGVKDPHTLADLISHLLTLNKSLEENNLPLNNVAVWNRSSLNCSLHQLLRGVTISNGGVLPRIHPELLSKKRGARVKVDSQASVPEKEERSKSKKPVKTFKKVKGKRGRKPKVRSPDWQRPTYTTLFLVCSWH